MRAKIVNKGEVFWVVMDNGNDEAIPRPFLVISNDAYNNTSHTPIGFLMSRSAKKINNNYHYKIMMDDGKESGVNVSQIYTVSTEDFRNKIQDIEYDVIDDVMKHFNDTIVEGY